jgi:hypothetical protein
MRYEFTLNEVLLILAERVVKEHGLGSMQVADVNIVMQSAPGVGNVELLKRDTIAFSLEEAPPEKKP